MIKFSLSKARACGGAPPWQTPRGLPRRLGAPQSVAGAQRGQTCSACSSRSFSGRGAIQPLAGAAVERLVSETLKSLREMSAGLQSSRSEDLITRRSGRWEKVGPAAAGRTAAVSVCEETTV